MKHKEVQEIEQLMKSYELFRNEHEVNYKINYTILIMSITQIVLICQF